MYVSIGFVFRATERVKCGLDK